jgi:uncharacterized cupredoxin-like copper-binding protein
MNRLTGFGALVGASVITILGIVPVSSAWAEEAIVATLVDKGMDSMRVDLSGDQVRAGKVTFRVTNTSQNLVHEFVVGKSDTPMVTLPYDEEQKEVKEDALKIVDEIEDIDPGKSGILAVTLEPGSYIVFCNKPGHFKAGMANQFTVTK